MIPNSVRAAGGGGCKLLPPVRGGSSSCCFRCCSVTMSAKERCFREASASFYESCERGKLSTLRGQRYGQAAIPSPRGRAVNPAGPPVRSHAQKCVQRNCVPAQQSGQQMKKHSKQKPEKTRKRISYELKIFEQLTAIFEHEYTE